MEDLSRYIHLKNEGADPVKIFNKAREDGLNEIECIKLLRQIFHITFTDVKKIILLANGIGDTLERHEENLIPSVEKVLKTNDCS